MVVPPEAELGNERETSKRRGAREKERKIKDKVRGRVRGRETGTSVMCACKWGGVGWETKPKRHS